MLFHRFVQLTHPIVDQTLSFGIFLDSRNEVAGRYFRLALMPQRKYTISAIERYPGTLVVLLPAISDGFVPTSSYIVRYYPRLACVLRVALCISGKDGCQEW